MNKSAVEDVGLIVKNTTDILSNLQQNYLLDKLYNVVDTGLDIGIKLLLPDTIEDEVIEIKNGIMENGLIGGIRKAVDCVTNFGKDVYGIVTGNFESVEQLESALKSNGTLDTISKFLDKGINLASSKGIIKNDVKKKLKSGKKVLINTIDDRLSNELKEQKDYLKKINQYVDNWTKYFEKRNFEKMEEIFDELKKYMEDIIPFKSTLETYKKVETLHNLIKNNGQNFDLSSQELELVQALSTS